MADRLDKGGLDGKSGTVRPCSVSEVGLATIPETTTFPLGVAVVGLSDVIAIHGCDRAPGWLAAAVRAAPAPAPGAAAAGTVASHPTPTAAAAAVAASRRPRRALLTRRSDPPDPPGPRPSPHSPFTRLVGTPAGPIARLARGSTPPPGGQAPGPHGPDPPAGGPKPRPFVAGHWPDRSHAMSKCYCRSSAAVYTPRSSLEDAQAGPRQRHHAADWRSAA